ncbi:MAG: acyl transferase [Reichenbachiella sp.]|uniref:acyl transferase n=1 Tax=Reichenbachiella sp. TaxID=2184521 RepID=UPI003266ADA3
MITGFRSKHHIEDVEYYLNNAQSIFENFYGPLEEKIFFALLPSYQEQGDSSLVQMVEFFIDKSGSFTNGGFYLNKTELLIADLLIQLENNTKQVILFGVGYALLDLAELASSLDVKLDGLTVIETGGMKGRRKDMVKEEFYGELKAKLGDIKIHSEYGMTELLSQAYSMNEKSFVLPDCMKILIRDSEDPFSYLTPGRAGGINVIDLANVHSCSFIETSDLGKILSDGTFTILGRLDNSDIRGCNLMIE